MLRHHQPHVWQPGPVGDAGIPKHHGEPSVQLHPGPIRSGSCCRCGWIGPTGLSGRHHHHHIQQHFRLHREWERHRRRADILVWGSAGFGVGGEQHRLRDPGFDFRSGGDAGLLAGVSESGGEFGARQQRGSHRQQQQQLRISRRKLVALYQAAKPTEADQ